MRDRAKIVLITLSLLLGGGEIARRIDQLGSPEWQPVGLAAFAVLFAAAVISILGCAMIRQGWLRWSLAALFAAGSIVIDSYQWAVGDFMDYDAFVTMLISAGELGDALKQQGLAIIFALIKAAILFVGIALPRRNAEKLAIRIARVAALPIILAITILLFFRGGEGGNGLPASQIGTSFASLYLFETLTSADAPREDVTITADALKAPNRASDVILIIDESIAPTYLDINDPNGVYSGLIRTEPHLTIHNFGLAAAITHCSAGANASLRFGGTRENYQEAFERKPSIWAYARAAGFETIYIDAQRTGGRYQNLMDDAERALIDQWDQFDDVAVLQRDQRVADKIAEHANDDRAQMIIVNKVGVHFPVNDKFPDSHARYRPMLKRGQFADVTDMAGGDKLDGRASNWVLYRNSYRNSVLWNVGHFFDRLFEQTQLNGATIIYTADHGQHLHEQPDNGTATHCTPNPKSEEGVVPLVVITGPDSASSWSVAAARGKDKLSHYRIFPTLLRLLGYKDSDIAPTYGPDLLSRDPDPFTFNTRYNARLGRGPSWQHIDIDRLARPPLSDYMSSDHASSGSTGAANNSDDKIRK